MARFGQDARQFPRLVDIEATVDDDEDEDEDEDDMDHGDFIEDEPAHETQYKSWRHFTNMDENSDEEGWGDLLASLEKRYTPDSGIAEGNHRLPFDESHPIASSIDNVIRQLPRTDDYPLWRIRCKPGLEEEIIFFLLQMVAERHEIRSTFAHDSIRGWVYLEATMNEHLRKLLNLTPGVNCDRCGLVTQHIPIDEGLKLLKMRPLTDPPPAGEWVQVLKGTYKGDVGHILSTTSWGLQLLLVPRLSPADVSHSKRKRSQPRPPLGLFGIDIAVYDEVVPDFGPNICTVGSNRFEHGLIVKSYSFDSVSSSVSSMSLESFQFFRFSRHPKLTAFPRPSEWHFAEGDKVYILDSYGHPKSGLVTTLRKDSLEFTTRDGPFHASWLEILKLIREGDFVEVTGGMHRGRTGWIVGLDVGVASILPVGDDERQLAAERFEAQVNVLKHTTVPHLFGTKIDPSGAIPPSERVPWIGTSVIITGRHPLRTRPAVIKDVLCNQPTESGLRVIIEITYLDPNLPFPRLTLDYDNVLEASRGIKLYNYAPSKSELFTPRNKTSHWQASKLPPVLTPDLQYSATPIPESPFSSTPAWDPSSRTPQPEPEPDHSTSRSFDVLQQNHILLDSRLLNVELRVVVTGGKYNKKDFTASVQCVDGRLCIRRKIYKSLETLSLEWVTPKHPNPTRDNGLLVVIKGDHCGQYVRRIHHRYVDGEAVVILAAVNRAAGQVDTLTGERLELDVSFLCVCEESKEDKERNVLLMNDLREEARKTRAK